MAEHRRCDGCSSSERILVRIERRFLCRECAATEQGIFRYQIQGGYSKRRRDGKNHAGKRSATKEQQNLLRKLGYWSSTEDLTRQEAHDIIDYMLEKQRAGTLNAYLEAKQKERNLLTNAKGTVPSEMSG